jgi:type IV secretion system protein VirB9
MKIKFFLLALFIIASNLAFAVREPRATSMDSRLRVLTYNPNDVYKFTGYYGFQSSIVFANDETIETVSMGDTTSWQIVNSGNRMFLKPMEQNATTNMTVITNKRLYFFELHAANAQGIDDPGLAFQVKFLYQDNNDIVDYNSSNQTDAPDLSDLSKYNLNYTVSGSEKLSPIKIFDNGQFTYFEFKKRNQPIPAFFLVDAKGEEALVNYQVTGDYIVIDTVGSVFTLRYGNETACVFNEQRPLKAGANKSKPVKK